LQAQKEKTPSPERIVSKVAKEQRIKKTLDFKKAYKEGKRFLSPRFVLYVRPNGLSHARIGVSIAKRHFKLATKRNRLRRVAQELFRTKKAARVSGFDFVIASRGRREQDINEAVRELRSLIAGNRR